MISLYESNLTAILPNHLKTDNKVKAFCYAVDKQIKKILDRCKSLEIWSNLSKVDEDLLDYLAVELRTQYYSPDLSTEVKRNLIANSLRWYQKAGTVAAVDELITTVFGEGKVSEWHQYNGLPHHFKIVTENPNITGDILQEFNDIISMIKRKTAILDAVEISLNAYMNQYYGVAISVGDYITLRQEG